VETVTWARVLGWRRRRQFLDPPAGGGPVEVACVLCFGPRKGNRVTSVSADWLPKVPDAPSTVLRAFLGAYGPTTPELFDKVWLSRGNTRKALLRSWFAAL
jgi:hypothetical protein